MKNLGLVLIAVGFLLGALVAVESPENTVNWQRYLIGLGLAVVGVTLARIAEKRATQNAATVDSDLRQLRTSINAIVDDVRDIDDHKTSIDIYELHARIDVRLPTELAKFVDARKSLIPSCGLDAYADVMNCFAAGERYLNRVWSASVDGYIDEAQAYLSHSREQFEHAAEKISSITPTA